VQQRQDEAQTSTNLMHLGAQKAAFLMFKQAFAATDMQLPVIGYVIR